MNDSTFAIKKINLQVTRSANINWVKDIYIEQEFDVLNDSVFLLKRDYMMSDFSLSKKEKARGVYGKRTTVFNNYDFNKERPRAFYEEKLTPLILLFTNKPMCFGLKTRWRNLVRMR